MHNYNDNTQLIIKKDNQILCTVGQEISADRIFSRISRIFTKPRKYHDREYDLNDLFTKKAYKSVNF